MSKREDIAALEGIAATLEAVTANLGAASDRLDGERGYAATRRKIESARVKAQDSLFHLLKAIDLMEDREG